MQKKIGIIFAIVILIGIPIAAKASEVTESDDRGIKSYGTIIYEDVNGSVRIYAEDIALLQEKLASIPDEIFDPVLYSHTHVWEYIDITEEGHTKHCSICGSKYDVVNPHVETESKTCTISLNGQKYSGYEKSCECGYTWEEEVFHTPVYTPKDDVNHTLSCALEGTPYCAGMETSDAAHEMLLKPTDGTHHQNICKDCGYMGNIEECVFDIEEDITSGEGIASGNESGLRIYCKCGNYVTKPKADMSLHVTENVVSETESETEEKNQAKPEEIENQEGISNPAKSTEISVSGNDINKETSTKKIADEVIEEEGEGKL